MADESHVLQCRVRARTTAGTGGRPSRRDRHLGPDHPASAHFTAAATTAIDVLLDDCTPADLDEPKLLDAGGRASALTLESATRRATIRLKVFSAALAWLQAGHTPRIAQLFGTDFSEPGIRTGMELCYRALAHETTDMWQRIALVEEANAIRPRTRV